MAFWTDQFAYYVVPAEKKTLLIIAGFLFIIMIITISGTPGSGKSTAAEMLSKKLKAERIYVGGIRRELAREKGMTLQELNQYAATHPETDVDVDKKAAAQARELEKKKKSSHCRRKDPVSFSSRIREDFHEGQS